MARTARNRYGIEQVISASMRARLAAANRFTPDQRKFTAGMLLRERPPSAFSMAAKNRLLPGFGERRRFDSSPDQSVFRGAAAAGQARVLDQARNQQQRISLDDVLHR